MHLERKKKGIRKRRKGGGGGCLEGPSLSLCLEACSLLLSQTVLTFHILHL